MYYVRALPEVPEIIQGVAAGSYQVMGGVVRNAMGNKEIVAHLRDVGDLTNVLSKISSVTNSAAFISSINLGVGILNLSLAVASHVILSKKLDALKRSLDELTYTVKEMKTDLDIIKYVELFKDLFTALREMDVSLLKDSQRRKDHIEFVKHKFIDSRTGFHIAMERIKGNFDPYRPEFLVHSLKGYVLSSFGNCRMWCEQEEPQKALKDIREDYRYSRESYDYLTSHSKVGFGAAGFGDELKALNFELQKLWSYKEEISAIDKEQISFNDWKRLTDGKQDGLYIICQDS